MIAVYPLPLPPPPQPPPWLLFVAWVFFGTYVGFTFGVFAARNLGLVVGQ